ncbi:AraC family transcriptional regulator [Bradyrhizobium manausense]|uniref:AraC family transcriptional regulator n=1 Tax=Bradyrhizobium TaxID=374 RepID=UPI001BA82317|nr:MULTISPECIES: AraC family transcriptional regulator [Bradyrhizobium]MBR0828113.1 AraC family transcriptional regulator [Bradyrhizobium manausense]UVO32969.1 AraC family transcriptional regulator [Bradyrhizobium arachidis]
MSGTAADRCKVPRAFWQTVEHIGVPPAALLRQAKLPATLHLNEQGQVTTNQFFALWKALEQLKPEPGLGLKLVQRTETAVHPPSSLAAFYARDYRDGLLRIARFKRLCSPEQLSVEQGKDECIIRAEWPYASEPEPAISTDVTFASLVELGRRGTGQHLTPKRVELVRPRPKSDAYQDYFACPLRFGAAQNLLILKPADLDRPFPGHNQELLEILTPALASALGELQARSSIREQVKVVLKRSLASGRPDLSEVARDLGLSERTLQRRITEEDTSFRDLLVEARQELGRQLLSDPTAEIDEVACLLGYQDASSFYRAFRYWEGVTPSRWRELHGNKIH